MIGPMMHNPIRPTLIQVLRLGGSQCEDWWLYKAACIRDPQLLSGRWCPAG